MTRIITIVHAEMMLSNQHTLKIILMIVITVTIVILIIMGPDQTYENSPKTKIPNITVLGIVVTAGTTTNEAGARIASLTAL